MIPAAGLVLGGPAKGDAIAKRWIGNIRCRVSCRRRMTAFMFCLALASSTAGGGFPDNVSLAYARRMRAMARGAANYRLPHLFPESVHGVLSRDAVFAVHDHLVRNFPEEPGHSFCRVVIPGRQKHRCGILIHFFLLYVESSLSL